MRALMLLSVVVCLAIVGCVPIDGGTICTDIFVYGVTATVSDDNGDPVTGATVILTDGEYSETMEELGTGSYAGAGERPGTYTLTVEAEGFEPIAFAGLVVDSDECHVIPISQHVDLSAE